MGVARGLIISATAATNWRARKHVELYSPFPSFHRSSAAALFYLLALSRVIVPQIDKKSISKVIILIHFVCYAAYRLSRTGDIMAELRSGTSILNLIKGCLHMLVCMA